MSYFIKSLTLRLASGLSLIAVESAQAQVIVGEPVAPLPAIATETPTASDAVAPSPQTTNPISASIGSSTPTAKIPGLTDLPPVSAQATDLMAQDTPTNEQVTKVTGVNLQPTETGVEVKLQTSPGQTLQPVTQVEGNTLIADIDNAVLAPPEEQGFSQQNPAAGITEVTVTQIAATRIQVRVTGVEAAPIANVVTGTEGLVLAVTPGVGEEEEVEITVTAEQQEEESGYRVPDATTATKTDTPLRDIPQSIQVIPKEVIKDQKATRIFDVLRNVSGVSLEKGYGDNTDNPRIRGFVNFDSLRNGFFAQDPSINANNIERVEVLKGPASVLYGQFEPGGIVNYVTKKPLDEPYYSAEFTVGNYDFYNPSFDISGPLNKDKTLLYRLNVSYLNSGSFVDFVDQQQFGLAAALTYKISDATTLDFEYEHINERRTFYDGLLPDPVSFQLPISRFLNDPSSDDYTASSNNIYLTFNHRFSDNLKLRSSFGAQIGTFSSATVRPGSLLEDGRTISRGFQIDDNVEQQSFSFQTDLIGKFKTGPIQHQALLGVEWSRNVYANDYYFDPDNATVPPLDLFNPVYGGFPIPDRSQLTFDPFRNERDTIGIYLQDQITLLPNLKLLLGGRYDFIDRKNTGLDTEENLYDEAFSPRVGIVYQPIEPISLYASYSRSFNPSTNRTADGALFEPERGTQYEVGVKRAFIK